MQIPSRSQVSHRKYYKLTRNFNQTGAHNVGCANGSAPTGALPWAQRCMRVDSSPWVHRSALTGAQLNATRIRSSNLASASCHLDLWPLHLINMCLPGLVKICQIILEISGWKGFDLFQCRVTLPLISWPQKLIVSCHFSCPGLLGRPLMPMCVEIGSFAFKTPCTWVW